MQRHQHWQTPLQEGYSEHWTLCTIPMVGRLNLNTTNLPIGSFKRQDFACEKGELVCSKEEETFIGNFEMRWKSQSKSGLSKKDLLKDF